MIKAHQLSFLPGGQGADASVCVTLWMVISITQTVALFQTNERPACFALRIQGWHLRCHEMLCRTNGCCYFPYLPVLSGQYDNELYSSPCLVFTLIGSTDWCLSCTPNQHCKWWWQAGHLLRLWSRYVHHDVISILLMQIPTAAMQACLQIVACWESMKVLGD